MINLAKKGFVRFQNNPQITLLLLFFLCLVIYLITIPLPRVDGMLIGSDGVGYYMYVRSLFFDRDLNFANEYSVLRPDVDITRSITSTGLIANQFAIGPGILWSPFFIAGHFIVLVLRQFGIPIAADGYGYVYQTAVGVGSIVYGSLAVFLTYRTMRRFYPQYILAASLLIWLATNFIYYLIVEPSMSHMCSMFSVALLLYVWIHKCPVTRMRDYLLIGLVGGLVGIVRQPDATLLALPMLDCLLNPAGKTDKFKRLAAVLVGFSLIFWIQMATWYVLYGNPFISGYFYTNQGFSWLSPHLFEVLFSTEHGLFLWHPILLFAFLGFAYHSRYDLKLTILFILGIIFQAYLIASWSSWSQADSFGGRMFIASLPLFTLGLSAFLHWVSENRLAPPFWIISIFLIFWNALFLIQYRFNYISMSGPYTLEDLTVGKFEMLIDLGQKVFLLATR